MNLAVVEVGLDLLEAIVELVVVRLVRRSATAVTAETMDGCVVQAVDDTVSVTVLYTYTQH